MRRRFFMRLSWCRVVAFFISELANLRRSSFRVLRCAMSLSLARIELGLNLFREVFIYDRRVLAWSGLIL